MAPKPPWASTRFAKARRRYYTIAQPSCSHHFPNRAGEGRSVGTCGGRGPENVYQLDITQATRLQAEVTGYDTVLYLRTSCDEAGSELACSDDHPQVAGFGSRINRDLQPGRYFLFVDAYGPANGDYTLTVDGLESGVESLRANNCACTTPKSGPPTTPLFFGLALAAVGALRRMMRPRVKQPALRRFWFAVAHPRPPLCNGDNCDIGLRL